MHLYIHSPIRLHEVVLNYLSTGTTLPFYVNHSVKGGFLLGEYKFILYDIILGFQISECAMYAFDFIHSGPSH
jgi:hypothetical protein